MPWDSAYMDTRDYLWNDVAVPFWTDIAGARRRCGCQGVHRDASAQHRLQPGDDGAAGRPRSTPRTSAPRWTRATCSGRASTRSPPSRTLGSLVFNAAAKDTRINEAAKVNGVLDDRFGRIAADERAVRLGGRYTLTRWPENASWDFVAVGRGHDVSWWSRLPRRAGEGRPRHAGQHRARGPGARPDRGPAVRRRHPAASRRPLIALICRISCQQLGGYSRVTA